MASPDHTQTVIEIIQLALTPVFLIVGIAQLLNVVTNRVARIIDRARGINQHNNTNEGKIDNYNHELSVLDKRLQFANWAITCLTGAAVLICLDIILLILNGLIVSNLEQAVLGLFIASIASITGGLFSFFIEVSLATATLKVNIKQVQAASNDIES